MTLSRSTRPAPSSPAAAPAGRPRDVSRRDCASRRSGSRPGPGRHLGPALLAAVLGLLTPLLANATPAPNGGRTWYVDASYNGPGLGRGTQAEPYKTLVDALADPGVGDGDRILVATGVYAGGHDLGARSLEIVGAGSGATVLDGGGTQRVLRAQGSSAIVSLEGLSLRGGLSDQGGGLFLDVLAAELRDVVVRECTVDLGSPGAFAGGIFASAGFLLFRDVRVEDVPDGGGLHLEDAVVLMSRVTVRSCRRLSSASGPASGLQLEQCDTLALDCHFEDNGLAPFGDADRGTALRADGGTLDLRRCALVRNRPSFRGGALALFECDATLLECHFANNRSEDQYAGGAVYLSDAGAPGELTAVDCTFVGNESGDGGALFLGQGLVELEGCAFEGNVSESLGAFLEEGRGGALVALPAADVTVTRSTFLGNEARGDFATRPARGGAVWGHAVLVSCSLRDNRALDTIAGAGTGGAGFDAELSNSISRGNAPDELTGPFAQATFSDVEGGFPDIGNIDVDPQWWNPERGDLHLWPSSPCRDSGDPFLPPDPDGSQADMGAFPVPQAGYQAPPQLLCPALPNSSGSVATLAVSGSPTLGSEGDFHLRSERVVSGQFGFLLLSPGRAQIPFYGHLLCLAPPFQRSGVLTSGGNGNGDDSGVLDAHLDQPFLAGLGVAVGEPLHAQFWFRDPGSPFLAALSPALVFTPLP